MVKIREIYFIQNNILDSITLRYDRAQNDYIPLSSIDDLPDYFHKNPIGKILKERKNLNIILQVEDASKRKLLEDKLHGIGFKKAFISYELPYEKARTKYELE